LRRARREFHPHDPCAQRSARRLSRERDLSCFVWESDEAGLTKLLDNWYVRHVGLVSAFAKLRQIAQLASTMGNLVGAFARL
jgi:hypothetical protein